LTAFLHSKLNLDFG